MTATTATTSAASATAAIRGFAATANENLDSLLNHTLNLNLDLFGNSGWNHFGVVFSPSFRNSLVDGYRIVLSLLLRNLNGIVDFSRTFFSASLVKSNGAASFFSTALLNLDSSASLFSTALLNLDRSASFFSLVLSYCVFVRNFYSNSLVASNFNLTFDDVWNPNAT